MQLNFTNDMHTEVQTINGFLCSGDLSMLEDNRGVNTVKCPLDGAIHKKSFAGQLCQTCKLCTLGEEALGLTISLAEGTE
jgi:hypothetical protein